MKTCSRPDCAKPHVALELCGMHYARMRKGLPLDAPPRGTSIEPAKRYVVTQGGCWRWLGSLAPNGYGAVRVDGVRYMAHRWMYQLHRGEIPEGLHIDHLCRNRACVNPQHLEPVTPGENLRRGEHPNMRAWRANTCTRGHEYTEENTRVDPKRGTRHCRTCQSENERRRRRERVAS